MCLQQLEFLESRFIQEENFGRISMIDPYVLK